MDISDFIKNENEKPLDRLVTDGGFTGIFRSIAAVGDSLSSGEFESIEDGVRHYHDCFDYSWGQYIARMAGTKVINMSRGGMTAREYCTGFADKHGYFSVDLKAGAYIIALAENDCFGQKQEVGSVKDINPDDFHDHPDTFAGWYGEIILRYKQISPGAKFFLVCVPNNGKDDERHELAIKVNALFKDMADFFDNTYIIDLFTYGPVYDDEFRKNFFLEGHMNPMGYMLTAKMFTSYIDYIIRNNTDDFKKIAFIPAQYVRTDL